MTIQLEALDTNLLHYITTQPLPQWKELTEKREQLIAILGEVLAFAEGSICKGSKLFSSQDSLNELSLALKTFIQKVNAFLEGKQTDHSAIKKAFEAFSQAYKKAIPRDYSEKSELKTIASSALGVVGIMGGGTMMLAGLLVPPAAVAGVAITAAGLGVLTGAAIKSAHHPRDTIAAEEVQLNLSAVAELCAQFGCLPSSVNVYRGGENGRVSSIKNDAKNSFFTESQKILQLELN